MIMFERNGCVRDQRRANLVRDVSMGALLTAGAILLFPFTLLIFFLWGLGALGTRRVARQ